MTFLASSAHWGDPERITAVEPNIHNSALVTSWVSHVASTFRAALETLDSWRSPDVPVAKNPAGPPPAIVERPSVDLPTPALPSAAVDTLAGKLRRHRRAIGKPTL